MLSGFLNPARDAKPHASLMEKYPVEYTAAVRIPDVGYGLLSSFAPLSRCQRENALYLIKQR